MLTNLSKKHFQIQPEITHAIKQKKPVVALESTIISHGMPYPQNVNTAKEVEEIVRAGGAVPATIAIIDGVICVGLSEENLEKLGKLGHAATKTSRCDIASVLARHGTGATTVSATMLIASMVGIKVFVTGGIGGVHRGAETTMDISADLTELGRTPVAVVCAGAKSILDIGLTLEFLETQGVTVIGYGTDEFPAFYVPNSGFKAPVRSDSPEECAKVIYYNHVLGIKSGIVIGCPIPSQFSAEAKKIEDAIQQALREASEKKIKGKETTPFLLQRINELTGGESLKSNIQLVKNNATIGAAIACSLSQLNHQTYKARL